VPAIFLVRTEAARQALRGLGVEHVIATSDGFTDTLAALSAELGTTAVFDGVGGDLLGKMVPSLPMNSTLYIYGFLGASAPLTIQSVLFMMKNLTLRRFSNFESATVKDTQRLAAALKVLEGWIDEPMFRTRIGQEFGFAEIDAAMAYEAKPGAKAVLAAGR